MWRTGIDTSPGCDTNALAAGSCGGYTAGGVVGVVVLGIGVALLVAGLVRRLRAWSTTS
jgi:hypothetical protein